MSLDYKLRIRECKRNRAKELDLSGQDISIVPEEAFSLTFLRTLCLSNNGISNLDDRICELADLETIDLRNNVLQKFPFCLLKLPKLKTVKLSGNKFTEEFAFLEANVDQLEALRKPLAAILERSIRSFKEDFFEETESVLQKKGSIKESEKEPEVFNPLTAKEKEIEELRLALKQMTAEKAQLQEILSSQAKLPSFVEPVNDLPTEIQIRNLNELQSFERLSQGGFSIIEKGNFKGTFVAIKRFFDPNRSAEVKEEFINEVRMLNRLRHPSVITLMGYHLPSIGGNNFLVFEYLPNGNLYEILHVKRMKFDKKMFLLKLAEVLHFIHLSGICHRDLKSLNIMMTPEGHPKLIDFGLARNFEELNRGSLKFAATAAYSAPELFLQKEITCKVDVYAFGIILWEVMSEDIPFHSMQMNDIKKFVSDKGILSCKGLSSAYGELVKACCAFFPEARPSFADLIKRIEKISN